MHGGVRLVAVALVLLSLAGAAVTVRDVERRVGRPFAGVPVFGNGAVGPPFVAPHSSAARAGLRYLDRIVAVGGEPLRGGAELWAMVDRVGANVPLRYTVLRPGAGPFEVTLATEVFTRADFVTLVLPLLVAGLLMLAVTTVPVMVRPQLPAARVLFLFGWAEVTNYCFLVWDYFFGYRVVSAAHVADALAQASLLHLAGIFPKRRWPLTRWPRGALVVIYGSVGLRVLVRRGLGDGLPLAWISYLDIAAMLTLVAGAGLLVANVACTATRSGDPVERQRARVVLLGPMTAVVVTVLLAVSAWSWMPSLLPVGAYALVLWTVPLSMAYAILKHNLFEFDAVARRGLSISVLVLGVTLAYLAAFSALRLLAGEATAWASALLSLVAILALTFTVEPLRRRVERRVEAIVFPEYRHAADVLYRAARDLAGVRDLPAVAALLRDAVGRAVHADGVRLVVGERRGGLAEVEPAARSKALLIAEIDPLAEVLRRGQCVDLDGDGAGPGRAMRHRLAALGIRLVVPLPFPGGRLAGGLLLGARTDGRLYTTDDERLLETLAAQSAVAIETARAFEALRVIQRRATAETVHLRREIQRGQEFGEIIGESVAIRAVLAQIAQVAPTDATVLVLGETGTGKELVVRALHANSKRRDRSFIRVACAAIPETLFESELFGHERGAFTGAGARQLGRFELAHGGTIFLDDADTMPLAMQPKLLRAIQEGEVQRLGAAEPRRVDVRVIAASNKDLAAEVRAGRFREDLYYRLNVVPIRIPPLRERSEDVPLLVEHFVRAEAAKLGRTVRGVSEEALAALRVHAWPGNVRELRNVIARAVLMDAGDVLRLAGPLCARVTAAEPGAGVALDGRPLAALVRAYKVALIERALDIAGGNQRRAAELLGLHRPSLSRMLRELGITVRVSPRP